MCYGIQVATVCGPFAPASCLAKLMRGRRNFEMEKGGGLCMFGKAGTELAEVCVLG